MNYDTMKSLEGKLGKGLPTMGGHPSGARVWLDWKTGWTIYADGFERVNGGVLLEGMRLDRYAWPNAPKARNPQFGILKGIRPGMTLAQVKTALHGQRGTWQGLRFIQTGSAEIRSASNSETFRSRRWIAEFEFEDKKLAQISLYAD